MLIISFVEWSGAFQRPHHLALGFARRGWEVTYACPGYLHRQGERVASGLELPANLRVIEPPALPGSSRLAMVAGFNEWLMRQGLARESQQAWDAIVFNDPRWATIARTLPARLRVFDAMDDLSAMAPSADRAERLEGEALAVADHVWAATGMMQSRVTPRHGRVRFIPCGVDAERFGDPDPEQVEAVRAQLPPGSGPVAGFFGVLNERIDGRLLEALLDSAPWRIVLLGPATSRAPVLPDNRRLARPGPRPYAELPAWLATFDLALIPYDAHGPNRFLYPVKALEYLAGGVPVLSTPLPDVVRFLGEFVELADTPEAWREAGRRLAADPAPARLRAREGRRYAHGRSWDAMVDEMHADLLADKGDAS